MELNRQGTAYKLISCFLICFAFIFFAGPVYAITEDKVSEINAEMMEESRIEVREVKALALEKDVELLCSEKFEDYKASITGEESTKEEKTEKPEKENNNKYGYTDEEIDLICAIVAQEDNGSYEGGLAVMSTAINRANSDVWGYLGDDPLEQFCAPGQFTYATDGLYVNRLNGNYPDYIKEAVMDGLNGKINHNYLSFRGYEEAEYGEVIGGNWYF